MSEPQREESEDQVAILAMVCRVPGAQDVEELWENLRSGVESISTLSAGELAVSGVPPHLLADPAYVRARGVLSGVDLFDAGLFGLTPREAEVTDPQHRILLECAWEAMEAAGYGQEEQAGPVGVFVGAEQSDYLSAPPADLEELVGSGSDFLATRISYKLNLRGPSLTVQTACSTSLVAVHLAVKGLLDGECDMALAGGVSLRLPQERGHLYQSGGIYSPDGHCRAFDAEAQGTVGGHGAGIVLLKRLPDALADGDRIRAVLRGSSVNNDGAGKVGFTAPGVDGQARCIAEALALARVAPETIGYVETHGTGTPLGDPIEIAALTQAFGLGPDRRATCALGAIKSNLGHLGAAAGVVGLIKTVLILEHGEIPPTLHFRSPNPRIDFASGPFHVNARRTSWPRQGSPRRAGVSSFGMGGTNVHVVLEEPPAARPVAASPPWHLLPLSARSESALDAGTERLAEYLKSHPDLDLADVAYTLQMGRRAFEHRRIAVCADLPDAVAVLAGDRRRMPARRRPGGIPEIAFLFPGQGAQQAGLGRELYGREEVFRAEVDRSCEILRAPLGFDLREALFPERPGAEAADRLAETAVAQPALFVLEHALSQLWMSWGARPGALLGHSLGEYVAACLAGVFSLEEALLLVAARGALMQQLPPGAMLAVALPEEEVVGLLGSTLSLAAVNAPERTVVSGPAEAVEELAAELRGRGLPCRSLATFHAFHSAAVEPILSAFADRVRAAVPRAPQTPLVSNVTGTWITDEEATDPAYWARHLRATVRFAAGVRRLAETSGRLFLEVGPGESLCTLVRQNLRSTTGQEVAFPSLPRTGEEPERASLLRAAGGLWLAGVRIDGSSLHTAEGRRARRVPLPAYPFEHRSFWRTPLSTAHRETPMAEPVWVAAADSPRRQQIQSQLRSLFATLFGVATEELSPDATFLEMGADSLFLLRASQQIEERLGTRIPFRRLIEELSTVAALAAHLAPAAQGETAQQVPPGPIAQPPAVRTAAATEDLRSLFAEQLRILERQLDLLAGAAPAAEPRPAAPPPESPLPQAAPARQAYVPYRPIERAPGRDLTPLQREHLDRLVARLAGKTRRSKELTQSYRRALANSRASAGFRLLFKELVYPLVGQRGAGAHLWDVDGNEYVDLTMGFGSLFFGHSPTFLQAALATQLDLGVQVGPESETAGEVAALLCELTGVERATFCNSGTEAVMVAVRLARAVTGRTKIALFAGSFHGTFDGLLAQGERQADGRLRAVPLAPGIPSSLIADVLLLDYEGLDSLAVVEAHAHELAAVLVEPRQTRRPDLDRRELLRPLRALTERAGIALIFDEVVTGFRVHSGGMQALYGVHADIVTYGKAVANGMPIGVVAGKAAFLDAIDGGDWRYGDRSLPEAATTFFGGTFFRHPLVMAAALACLRQFQANPGLQEELRRNTARLVARLDDLFAGAGLPVRVLHFSSFFLFDFSDWTIRDLFFFHLLDRGIYVWESRLCYLSTAHTEADLERIVAAVRDSLREMREGGFLPAVPATPTATDPVRLPLTEAQRELWALAQLGETASVAYNLSISLHLSGLLRRDALARALETVVGRHEALRVTVDPLGESQTVSQRCVALPSTDLAALAGEQRERALEGLLAAEAGSPFNLTRGPLLRFHLIHLAAARHVLSVTVHHIVIDGHSFRVLLDEIAAAYAAAAAGEPCRLPAPALYSRRVAAIAAREQGSGLAVHEAFWRQRFSPPPPPLELPTDRLRPPVRSFRGSSRVGILDPDLTAELRRLAGRLGATTSTLLLAGVMTLLHRLTGQSDLVVGLPAAGQSGEETEPFVGYCLTLLPLRAEVTAGTPFADLVTVLQKEVLDAHEHREIPLSRLIRRLGLPYIPSRPTLAAVTFNLDGAADFAIPGLGVELASNPISAAQFEIEWNVVPAGRSWRVECPYSSDLFDPATVARWHGYLRNLFAGAAATPRRPLGELDILPAEERRQLLAIPSMPAAPDGSLPERFEAQADRRRDAVASACDGARLTYGELARRSRRLVQSLTTRGVGTDSVVALLAPRGLDFLTAALAVLRTGAAYLPLEPEHPASRWREILAQSGARAVLVAPTLAEGLRAAVADLLPGPCPAVLDLCPTGTAGVGSALEESPLPPPLPGSLAYVIYTSGSTGAPKGVLIEHRGLLNHLDAMIAELDLDADDPIAQTAPPGFDISVWQLLTPLLLGGRVEIYGDDLVRQPLELLARVEADAISILEIVPSLLAALLGELERLPACGPSLAALRWLLPTGEALPPDVCGRWLSRYPRVPLVNAYGPAECADDVSLHFISRPPEPGTARMPLGRPVAHTRLHVVDAGLQPVPMGVQGELSVGGIAVGRGYLGDPCRTAAAFAPDPFSPEPGKRLYRTGDLARRRPDGEIELLGRIDHQLKIRGFRIEPGEIEAELARHPALREAVVTARPGPGGNRLIAYVVPREGQTADTPELRRFLGERLPAYMVPAVFVSLAALPLSANGKLDRQALPAPSHPPVPGRPSGPPLTPAEKTLAAIWQQLLEVRQIGVEDRFLDLGGDSILGLQLLARARGAGLQLHPRQVLANPSLSELAATAGGMPEGAPTLP